VCSDKPIVVILVHIRHLDAQLDAERHRTAKLEDFPSRAIDRSHCFDVAAPDRTAKAGDKVVQGEGARAAALDLLVSGQWFERLLRSEACKVAAMPFLRGLSVGRSVRIELLPGVFVNADVHAEIRLEPIRADADRGHPDFQQALVDQRFDHVHHRRRV